MPFSQKEYTISQNRHKYFPHHEDIDMYFAACFNSNLNNKEEYFGFPEKESTTEKCLKEPKKSENVILRPEIVDEAG